MSLVKREIQWSVIPTNFRRLNVVDHVAVSLRQRTVVDAGGG